jgi:Tfp pilus assembly protein PilP
MIKCFLQKNKGLILLVLGIVIIAAAAKDAITSPPATEKTEKTVAPNAYEYNARGRRDPFATLIVKLEAERKKGAVPIESYDIIEFKLSAILWNKSGYYALVSVPDGKNFTLKEGTTVGLHRGKVYKITKNSVIIREFLKDYRGTVKPKDTVLKLHREEEG